MVRLIDKKLKASTLIEVLVAMVIIMIVFAIATRIFLNVMDSGVSFKKIQAQQELMILAKQTQINGFIEQQTFQKDSINYVFKSDTTALMDYRQLTIQAYQQNRLLAKTRCYYLVRESADEN